MSKVKIRVGDKFKTMMGNVIEVLDINLGSMRVKKTSRSGDYSILNYKDCIIREELDLGYIQPINTNKIKLSSFITVKTVGF